mmetsp:Transcript_24065/g.37733  ORF Transcript_24065/g.37733 Transcript_24065/m.37733 type:complete len:223 (-) Transcript_24065:1019-1687(-)|eukprot:CAMPEP_0201716594 /NCGR_PEP_ID=MMETSP0593-20130828/2533_1 /ASSEMBLY_ACC=CAM_ASM_000672 /TAXON_ID=267983 /ORGANISM="Skeletonema japonicum, Strain CCMP2506" /LENGTH=222 /DNA_ID=CAMNT_0048206429 /DNA_START=47 /DNA_END=715 /DNA_ORIENTATION=+
MAPLSTLFTSAALLATGASAFTPASPSTTAVRPSTNLYENFGFDFAEDQVENTPQIILGEANYKKWVNSVDPDNMLNRQYALLTRVRELGLLEKTAELGILSKLEKNGLTLEKAEALLPKLEELGVLSLVANNQQLLINGVAPIAVEGAPILLPVVAGALDVGPAAFFLAAAGAGGLDAYLFASGAEVPFIGLPAGAVAGLLLIPLTAVSAGVGVALGSLKN